MNDRPDPDRPREPWDERPDRPREPWDERPDWPHGQWDEVPGEPPMSWDERPPRRPLGMPRRPPGAGREWDATDLLRNQLTRVLFGDKQPSRPGRKHPRAKNPDAESRQPSSGQAE